MMAHALGGRVGKSARGWGVGVHEFRIEQREPWMVPPLDAINVLMSCQDQVEDCPRTQWCWRTSAQCPVAMYRVGSLLGIQGHPEFEPDYAAALLERRRDRIGASVADAAMR